MIRLFTLSANLLMLTLLSAGMSANSQTAPDSEIGAEPARWRAASENAIFELEVGPETGKLLLGKFQTWTLHLTDAEGADIFPARFALGGGMLGHGHGLPTQPRVTTYLGEGLYRIEGMKFNMAGDWTLYFVIETEQARDQAKVDVTVDY